MRISDGSSDVCSSDLVVNSPQGTAYSARIVETDRAMGGKTGTSQVRRITLAERRAGMRKTEDVPWVERDHALFVGWAPAHVPLYATAVVVPHGELGRASCRERGCKYV